MRWNFFKVGKSPIPAGLIVIVLFSGAEGEGGFSSRNNKQFETNFEGGRLAGVAMPRKIRGGTLGFENSSGADGGWAGGGGICGGGRK